MERLELTGSRRGSSRGSRGYRRRRTRANGNLKLGLLMAALVGVNVYVFFFRGGTSVPELLQASSIAGAKLPGGALASKGSPTDGAKSEGVAIDPVDVVLVKGSMRGHLGLSVALEAAGVSNTDAAELLKALDGHLRLRALQPQQTFEVRLDQRSRRVVQFVYHVSRLAKVVVNRDADGVLRVEREHAEVETKVVPLAGQIRSSLHQAVNAAGGSSAVAARFVDLFSWDVNWYTDPREGDTFRIVVEKQYLGQKFYRFGRILAAEYSGNTGHYRAYYYETAAGKGGYYDREGRSIRRAFLKTPLHFRRISSRFNLHRFHPILHRTKGHMGVDYAAAKGTPVWAAADGVVARLSRGTGAGNMVVLRHPSGVVTLYMHLDRFAAGIKPGKKVAQRTVIGYVGMTGLATGPHLHYGITVRGRAIDPASFKVPPGTLLPGAQRQRFLGQLAERDRELQAGAVAVADRS